MCRLIEVPIFLKFYLNWAVNVEDTFSYSADILSPSYDPDAVGELGKLIRGNETFSTIIQIWFFEIIVYDKYVHNLP